MPKLGYFDRGGYNFQCDECGRGFKATSMQKRWDGAWVCSTCWEPRQPQDFQRGVKDDPSVSIARPRLITAPLTTLGANLSSSATSLTVATGTGAQFLTVSTGKLLLLIQSATDPTAVEYVYCAAHAAGSVSFTSLTRGQLGTVAQAFLIGDLVVEIEYTP